MIILNLSVIKLSWYEWMRQVIVFYDGDDDDDDGTILKQVNSVCNSSQFTVYSCSAKVVYTKSVLFAFINRTYIVYVIYV